MRFLLSAILWLVLVGGLSLYTGYRDAAVSKIPNRVIVTPTADATFTLEITPTFNVEKDPFALDAGSGEAASVEVRLNGKSIPMPETPLERGRPLLIEEIGGILEGHNEVYIKASPPMGEGLRDNGVRLRLFRDNTVVAADTLWSSQGSVVSGTLEFKINDSGEKGHDHQ